VVPDEEGRSRSPARARILVMIGRVPVMQKSSSCFDLPWISCGVRARIKGRSCERTDMRPRQHSPGTKHLYHLQLRIIAFCDRLVYMLIGVLLSNQLTIQDPAPPLDRSRPIKPASLLTSTNYLHPLGSVTELKPGEVSGVQSGLC